MTPRVRLLLAGVLLALFCVDFSWGAAGHFNIDYGKLRHIALFALIPLSVGTVYTFWRRDERMASVMFSVAFLLLLAPLCTLLNYLAISIAGPRIDDALASYDRALGIYWPDLIMSLAGHPALITVLGVAYRISAFQIVVAIALLGFKSDPRDISGVCIATTICALVTIAFWTAAPSFGAYTVYDLSEIARKSGVIMDKSYPAFLVWVLAHGPGHIDVLNSGGLVGFPSFHTQEVVIALWYARKLRLFFFLLSLFSLVALISIPIQGGHHIVDVIGGIAVAPFGIWGASRVLRWLDYETPPALKPAASLAPSTTN